MKVGVSWFWRVRLRTVVLYRVSTVDFIYYVEWSLHSAAYAVRPFCIEFLQWIVILGGGCVSGTIFVQSFYGAFCILEWYSRGRHSAAYPVRSFCTEFLQWIIRMVRSSPSTEKSRSFLVLVLRSTRSAAFVALRCTARGSHN